MALLDNPVSSLGDGRKVVAKAGEPEALGGATACPWVVVVAETDNTGVICVGGSAVVAELAKRTGIPLEKGDSVTIPACELGQVYIDTTVNGDGVTFTYGVA